MEIDTSTEISALPPLEKPNDETILVSAERPAQEGRRKKLLLWEYFTLEHAGPDRLDARCKHCNRSFAYMSGTKVAGTSHLKRHIAHFEGLLTMEIDTSTKIDAPPPLEKPNDDTMLNSGERPSKQRKKKSRVWKYFFLEPAGPDHLDARCKHCNKSFTYTKGTRVVAGTSQLKRHIASFHPPKRRISLAISSLSKLTLDS